LLAQLKKQGLGIRALDNVFNAIVLSKILYMLCQCNLATWLRAIRICWGKYSKEPIEWASHITDVTLPI